LTQPLSELERLVARMFYNVLVQSCFALEDPNHRFVIEFQYKDGLGTPEAKTLDAVENKVYETSVGEGQAVFIANPKDLPALGRIMMRKGNASAVMDALDAAFVGAEHFTPREEAPFPLAADADPVEGAGNRHIRLVINPELKATHDVAVLFAWGAASDKDITLDLMAWPVNKIAEA